MDLEQEDASLKNKILFIEECVGIASSNYEDALEIETQLNNEIERETFKIQK